MSVDGVIWLTAHDYNRLRILLADLARQSRGAQAGVETLEEILDLARVADPETTPGDVVTLGSLVHFEDLLTREEGTVAVVCPEDADPACRRISVLSPLGAALLGESAGCEVELPLPHGRTRRIRIRSVAQPAEACDAHAG